MMTKQEVVALVDAAAAAAVAVRRVIEWLLCD